MSSFAQLQECETTNIDLAAALAAVGVPLRKNNPVRILTGHKDRRAFFFEQASPCGKFRTLDLIRAWDNKQWHRDHPEHPFAYVKVALHNRHRLIEYIKGSVPIFVAEKHGKLAFLSVNASPETERKVFQRLNSHR